MRLNVPPTKSSALNVSRDLQFAQDGMELLDQKRQILVLELMQYVEAARRQQTDVDQILAEAHAALREAAMRVGARRLARDAMAVPISKSATVKVHRVMGIAVPKVETESIKTAPAFGFAGGTVKSDEVMRAFSKALELIGQLAETQNAVIRLARELRKTQRRVNALDRIFIPDAQETLEYITATLEEREREAFVVKRMVRDRLRRASDVAAHAASDAAATGSEG
jgi:V/A-type H+/Na+-transporting ATPase subunit D